MIGTGRIQTRHFLLSPRATLYTGRDTKRQVTGHFYSGGCRQNQTNFPQEAVAADWKFD